MQVSIWIVTAIIVAIMFGAGQRILDKLRISDKFALLIMVAILAGIIIPPISIGGVFSFSIGGFLIPFILSVYLLIKAGWSMDLVRAFSGTILTAAIILVLEIVLPSATPEQIIVDNTYLYGIVAGLVAYFLGRSRRNAFVCSVFGITLASVAVFLYNISQGVVTPLALGSGGVFDTIILSIVISVGLAEFIGEIREASSKNHEKVYNFEAGRFIDEDTYINSCEKMITDIPQKYEIEEVENDEN